MKKGILIALLCVALIDLVSCGKQNEVVEENVQAVADAFVDGDIDGLVFGFLPTDNEDYLDKYDYSRLIQ